MATIIKIKRKSGIAYRVQYMINHKRHSRFFPVNTPFEKVKAFRKRIEAEVAEYRSGLTEQLPSIDGSSSRKNRINNAPADRKGPKGISRLPVTILKGTPTKLPNAQPMKKTINTPAHPNMPPT